MKKDNKLLAILKYIAILFISVSAIGLLIVSSLEKFSDYYLNTAEIIIVCILVSLLINYVITRYKKKKIVYNIEMEKLNTVNNSFKILINHMNKGKRHAKHSNSRI